MQTAGAHYKGTTFFCLQVCLAQGQWEAVCRFFESCGGVPTPETCPSWPLTFSPLPSESAAGDGCAVCGSSPSTVASEGRASPLALPLCVPTSEAGGGQMSEAVEQMLGPDSELPDAVASTREVSEPPGIQQATEGASDTASSCGDGLNCPGGAPQVEAAVDRLLGVGDDEAEHSPLTDCYFNCEEGEASGQSREEPLTDMPGGLEHPLDKSQSDVDGTEGCVPMAAALTSLATVTRRDSTQSALSRCHSEGQLTETGRSNGSRTAARPAARPILHLSHFLPVLPFCLRSLCGRKLREFYNLISSCKRR